MLKCQALEGLKNREKFKLVNFLGLNLVALYMISIW